MNDEPTPPKTPSDGPDNPDLIDLPTRVSLARLDPIRDSARFEATVRSIVTGAMSGRARLRRAGKSAVAGQRSVFTPLAAWIRPALAAAAAIVALAGTTLLLVPTPAVAAPRSLAESAGIPAPIVEWATTNHSPSATELIDTFRAAAVAARPTSR
ncbi:MAG TPA: hypothetical protein VHE78_16160 [Gemmatimonadaceae bacterium]|nr:hypothetical protein [Gemmatimonadaceae bacterium]